MKATGSVSERKSSMTDSIDEQEAAVSVHKLKMADREKTARKAA
jgi:hypothetical protein